MKIFAYMLDEISGEITCKSVEVTETKLQYRCIDKEYIPYIYYSVIRKSELPMFRHGTVYITTEESMESVKKAYFEKYKQVKENYIAKAEKAEELLKKLQ